MNRWLKTGWREGLIVLLLAGLVWGVFGRTVRFGFVTYDDGSYVSESSIVLQGLTRAGVVYAVTSRHADGWYPLTTLSLMLDATLYGRGPGGFHCTNVLLHMAAALALFAALRSLTGSVWRSAFVAAVFAVHPLRAESVAWISERKDVLSGLFFFLTLWAYARYARMSNVECRMSNVEGRKSRAGLVTAGNGMSLSSCQSLFRPLTSGWYWVTLLLFVCGLMSKPMVITLPCVLLLLDFWPLRRYGSKGVWEYGRQGLEDRDSACAKASADKQKSEVRGQRLEIVNRHSTREARLSVRKATKRSVVAIGQWQLLVEKLPMFALAAAAAAGTILAERGAVIPSATLPFALRAGNALRSYAIYIVQTVRPAKLAPFYPYPEGGIPLRETVGAAALLLMISLFVWRRWKKKPWLVSGWLWYLGMLAPVSGLLMQAGSQAHADRYTYLPQTGLILMIAWTAADILSNRRSGRMILAFAAGGILAALSAAAYGQTGIWRNGGTLWTHALRSTGDNAAACNNLGTWLMEEGRTAEAGAYYLRALRTAPRHAGTLYNLGNALSVLGRQTEAVPYYEKAVHYDPAHVKAWMNLGYILLYSGQPARAADCFKAALAVQPENEDIKMLLQQAVYDLRMQEDQPGVLADLNRRAAQAQKQGDPAAAAALYRQALELHPWHVPALNNLAWLLATAPDDSLRDGAEAVRLAERAVRLTARSNPLYLDTLAAACAEAGRFADAVRIGREALERAGKSGDHAQADKMESRLELYRQGHPFRQ